MEWGGEGAFSLPPSKRSSSSSSSLFTVVLSINTFIMIAVQNIMLCTFSWQTFGIKWSPFCSKPVEIRTKWPPFCSKPLKIETKWLTFCSDFDWFDIGIARNITITIAMTDHSKTEPMEILTLKHLVFHIWVFKPPLYFICKKGLQQKMGWGC